MNNLYFLSQLVLNDNLHDVLDVLLNKLSLTLYLYHIDDKTLDYVLIELPQKQASRILVESRSRKEKFSLEIRHSNIYEKKNGHNICISKEEHLARVRLQRNTVILLSNDKETIDEITFRETGSLKKGEFSARDLVVITDIDLITYIHSKELFEMWIQRKQMSC